MRASDVAISCRGTRSSAATMAFVSRRSQRVCRVGSVCCGVTRARHLLTVRRMRWLAVLVLLVAPVVARAEDDPPAPLPPPALPPAAIERGMLGMGVMLGADHFFHEACTVEAAIAIPDQPFRIRAIGALGKAGDFEGGGDFHRGTIGVETRCLDAGSTCGFVGFGVGYETLTWTSSDPGDMVEQHHGLVLAPRIGWELGSQRVRLRIALDAIAYHRHSNVAPTEWSKGFSVGLGLGYRLF